MATVAVNKKLARKVLALVDKGLVKGIGEPEPGKMCVEAVICYAMNLRHSDNPPCVSKAVRALKIRLNDSSWSDNEARTKGMRRLAIAQLGSDTIDDKAFAKAVAEMTIRVIVPIALRSAANIKHNAKHKQALEDAADVCEKEGTRASALNAKQAAAVDAAAYAAADAAAYAAAYADADAAAAAYAAADAAADAAAHAAAYADAGAAADAAAHAAADADAGADVDAAAYAYVDAAAYAAAYAAADAAAAAYAAAHAAADAAAQAAAYADAYADAYAAAAAYAAADAARNKILSRFADGVVEILIKLGSMGCKWLDIVH